MVYLVRCRGGPGADAEAEEELQKQPVGLIGLVALLIDKALEDDLAGNSDRFGRWPPKKPYPSITKTKGGVQGVSRSMSRHRRCSEISGDIEEQPIRVSSRNEWS